MPRSGSDRISRRRNKRSLTRRSKRCANNEKPSGKLLKIKAPRINRKKREPLPKRPHRRPPAIPQTPIAAEQSINNIMEKATRVRECVRAGRVGRGMVIGVGAGRAALRRAEGRTPTAMAEGRVCTEASMPAKAATLILTAGRIEAGGETGPTRMRKDTRGGARADATRLRARKAAALRGVMRRRGMAPMDQWAAVLGMRAGRAVEEAKVDRDGNRARLSMF